MSSKERPEFVSNIPDHLLEGATKEMKWIMEEMSKQGQCQSYLLDNQFQHGEILEKQNQKLDALDTKVSYTNGKVAASILQIQALEEKNKEKEGTWIEIKQIVEVKQHIVKMLSSKITYVVGGLVILGIFTVVKSPTLQEWIKTVLL